MENFYISLLIMTLNERKIAVLPYESNIDEYWFEIDHYDGMSDADKELFDDIGEWDEARKKWYNCALSQRQLDKLFNNDNHNVKFSVDTVKLSAGSDNTIEFIKE